MNGDIGIGRIIYQTRKRDAIHVPVAPVEAAEDLERAAHIGINEEGKATANWFPTIGIVDPYLQVPVKKGDRFYIHLYPGSVTSLRHQWEHPAFGPEVVKEVKANVSESEEWLRNYAREVNCQLDPEDAYTTLLEDLAGGSITYHGTDMHSFGELKEPDLLKHHAEVVLQKQINWNTFEYFSCTC